MSPRQSNKAGKGKRRTHKRRNPAAAALANPRFRPRTEPTRKGKGAAVRRRDKRVPPPDEEDDSG
ncbi:MAG: hypothetical protein EA405_11855 [Rhodospirillales bacterium]|nr:MAG: hypothetical protein EA405_11855 [Rhodospirillales bacterium]